MKKTISTLLILSCFSYAKLFGQAGSLDNSFSTDGKVTTSISGISNAKSMKIQPDNKIIVAGQEAVSIARYNSDGSLDNTFSVDGKDFYESNPLKFIRANMIDLQSDGKIIVTGDGGNPLSSPSKFIGLVRYNTDGTIDNSFGTSGSVIKEFGPSSALKTVQSYSLAVQSDNKILVGGCAYNSSNTDYLLMRLNTDGTMDNTFGTGGEATVTQSETDFWFFPGYIKVLIQPDGKIICVGSIINTSSFIGYINIHRFNSDGTLDNTFGSSGKVLTTLGSANIVAQSALLQPDGKIVVAGSAREGGKSRMMILRYTAAGSLDNTFSSDGTVTMEVGSLNDYGTSVAIQQDNKIIVGGYSEEAVYDNFALLRLNTDGSIDNSFNLNGRVSTDFGVRSIIGDIAIQKDNKIVAAGVKFNSETSNDFAVARYLSGLELSIVSKQSSDFAFSVFPNPGNKLIHIRTNKYVHGKLEIRCVEGRLLQNIPVDGTEQTIDMSSFAAGMYFLKLHADDGSSVFQKIIIE